MNETSLNNNYGGKPMDQTCGHRILTYFNEENRNCANCQTRIRAQKRQWDRNTRQTRELHSLCLQCGATLATGDMHKNCPACRAKSNRYNQKRYSLIVQQNLCYRCGKQKRESEEQGKCLPCRQREKTNSHRVRMKKEQEGICNYCGREPVHGGQRKCAPCAKRTNEYGKKRRETARASGVCTKCAHRPAMINRKSCVECNDKQQAYQEIKKARLQSRNGTQNPANIIINQNNV